MTRICWVSVAPGVTVVLDIGNICNCCVCTNKKAISPLNLQELKKEIPLNLDCTHLWHSSLEVNPTSRQDARHLEPRQDIHDSRSLRRHLRSQRYPQLVLIVRRVCL